MLCLSSKIAATADEVDVSMVSQRCVIAANESRIAFFQVPVFVYCGT